MKRKGQKRSHERGGRSGIHDRLIHILHHLDTAGLGWPSPGRIDQLLREDRERQEGLEIEAPPVQGERET